MPIHIPATSYIGINLKRSNDDEVPLGFLTPGGTDKAALKRIGTVKHWIGYEQFVHDNIQPDEYESFIKERPDAELLRENQPGEEYQFRVYKYQQRAGLDYTTMEDVENKPASGFRITQSIARCGWNGGNKVVRIEDPRGFELEISVDNLVKVMSMTTVINGVIQGECIWGRDGSSNILLPVNSEPYLDAVKNTTDKNKAVISLRDVTIGDTVTVKASTAYEETTGVYLGMYRVYHASPFTHIRQCDVSHWRQYYDKMMANNKQTMGPMINVAKRYVIQVEEDGVTKYKAFATIKITDIISKAVSGYERPIDLDMTNYKDVSVSSVYGVFAVSTSIEQPEAIAKTLSYHPIDFDKEVRPSFEDESEYDSFAICINEDNEDIYRATVSWSYTTTERREIMKERIWVNKDANWWIYDSHTDTGIREHDKWVQPAVIVDGQLKKLPIFS